MSKIRNPANHPMKVVRALMVITGHRFAWCDRMESMLGRKRWSIKVWGWELAEIELAKDILKKHGFSVEQNPLSFRIWVRDKKVSYG